MSWTKGDFVAQAFEEIGYASYIYDAMPEQLNSILKSLDAMMASWNAKGIRVGWPAISTPENSLLSTPTDVTDSANEAIYLNLAVRIGPRFGKQISQETKQSAKDALDALLIHLAFPVEMQLPDTMPSGAGTKYWRTNNRPFLRIPLDQLDADQGDQIDYN